MKRISLILLLVAVIGLALILKSDNNSGTTANTNDNSAKSSASAASSTGSIDIKNMIFSPSQITVSKGGTVTWTNNDTTSHTVVDDLDNVGGPSSGSIAPGQTYSFTFNKTGSFQYHCSLHPSMRGTIVVK